MCFDLPEVNFRLPILLTRFPRKHSNNFNVIHVSVMKLDTLQLRKPITDLQLNTAIYLLITTVMSVLFEGYVQKNLSSVMIIILSTA